MNIYINNEKAEIELDSIFRVQQIALNPIENNPSYAYRDFIIKTPNAKIAIRLFADNPKNLEIKKGKR